MTHFAPNSIHTVASLAASWRQPIEAAGYTHFVVVGAGSSAEVVFLAFYGS